jgi:hypothetical protein
MVSADCCALGCMLCRSPVWQTCPVIPAEPTSTAGGRSPRHVRIARSEAYRRSRCGFGHLACAYADPAVCEESPMADADDVCRIALALPHVEEIDSDGFDFRIAGKGFVWSYPERKPGRPRVIRADIAVLYVGDEAEKQALLLGEPRLFFTAPGYDGWPLVMLRLAEVDTERLTELVTDAWRMRAPQELAAEFDQLGS